MTTRKKGRTFGKVRKPPARVRREHPRHGSGKRRRTVRSVEVKVRVRVLRPMNRDDVLDAIYEAVESGEVPAGIELAWWDYAHERGGVRRESEAMTDADMDALMRFRDLILSSRVKGLHVGGRAGIRVARPDV